MKKLQIDNYYFAQHKCKGALRIKGNAIDHKSQHTQT